MRKQKWNTNASFQENCQQLVTDTFKKEEASEKLFEDERYGRSEVIFRRGA